MFDEPQTCPNCEGKGVVTITDERIEKYLGGLGRREGLRRMPNAKLATVVNEVQNYIRHRGLSPLVMEVLDELWWRLHAAEEPIEETVRKIEALQDDPAWLESPG